MTRAHALCDQQHNLKRPGYQALIATAGNKNTWGSWLRKKLDFYLVNMNSHEEEEDEGPSVDSAIAEERIAARRLRIQRRLEAAKRWI